MTRMLRSSDREPWTLDSGPWTLDPGLWTLDSGPRTLDPGLQQLLQPLIARPADRQSRAVVQDRLAAVLGVELDLGQAVDVEQVRAVDADEPAGVELRFEIPERLF